MKETKPLVNSGFLNYMDMEKEIVKILNAHSLPSVGNSEGFLRDSNGRFNKVAKDIAMYYEDKLKFEYERGLEDGYKCIPKI